MPDNEMPFDDDLSGAEQAGPVDPYLIEPVTLPSGVKVEFRSMAALTGDNVKWLRGADDREGSMAFYNELNSRAIHLLVDNWTLTAENGRPILVPRQNRSDPKAYLKVMSGIDLVALERHLKDPMDRLFDGGKDPEGE